jgi:hypothetical protein
VEVGDGRMRVICGIASRRPLCRVRGLGPQTFGSEWGDRDRGGSAESRV